ncbi:glycosyl hydrolase family 7-domain-containing protein [Stachybotrys elegans]|uniref:Glucanase n=1 Tax=Stachybotrys elegans TaxID=80388 RepID=A0A8K0SUN2_9HYPO|nr:glycosyl hydrolase family 7-domain-containing protein [Stachybotrys elegans]
MYSKIAAITALISTASAQLSCSTTTETHPPLTWQRCSAGGSCTNVAGSVTLDSNWRWLHDSTGTNCYTGNDWNASLCPDPQTCATQCCVDGAEYGGTYGISTSGSSLNLRFVTRHTYGTNIGSRVYLMQDENRYQMFNLLDNEFTFDVDVSNLPCGLNGALYFVSMDQDGGASKFPTNRAGAKYGTGYCDSQCPRDIKFIGGLANVEGWDSTNDDGGIGDMGACCAEMDIWEANSISSAYTPHPCTNNDYHVCDADDCGGTYSPERYAGDCDPDGCDFNSWRQGNRNFYGPGSSFTVNTQQRVTVVTQFLTSGGQLSEIKRFYVQNGRVIPNSESTLGPGGNSITADYCLAQKQAFNDPDIFLDRGGLSHMGEALRSMVLVLSVWDDYNSNMLWLDSTFPVDSTGPGSSRGSCSTSSGAPDDIRANSPNSNVIFSNIKFGPIGSTFNSGNPPPSSSSSRPPVSTSTRSSSTGAPITTTRTTVTTSTRTTSSVRTTSSSPGGTGSPLYGQCGGQDWTGPTSCASGCCRAQNQWYSQCLPC